jgi:hypothetical protein
MQPVRIDQRMAGRRDEFDIFQAGRFQAAGDKLCRPLDILLALGQGADAGYAKEGEQFVQKAAFVLGDVFDGSGHGFSMPRGQLGFLLGDAVAAKVASSGCVVSCITLTRWLVINNFVATTLPARAANR